MKKLLFAFPIVVLLGAGCNLSNQATSNPTLIKNPSPEQAPASSSDPTSVANPSKTLGIYQNNEFGFEFQFPQKYKADPLGSAQSVYLVDKEDPLGGGNAYVHISWQKNTFGTIDEYIKQSFKVVSKENKDANGNTWVVLQNKPAWAGGSQVYDAITQHGDYIYDIYSVNDKVYLDIANQVLSTFKFTK